MIVSELQLRLSDPAATEVLGSALARALPSVAEQPGVCYLRGELGAGKTTCVRGLLRALGIQGLVRSPSYTLIETYRAGSLDCVHIDLYRLRGAAELEDLGLREYWTAGCLLLVEWPERAAEALAPADLELEIEYADVGRAVSLRAAGPFGTEWLTVLLNDSRIIPYLPNLT
jgi:tRNA threonylcarbamoyladenosine biosynthesis protein TsaE